MSFALLAHTAKECGSGAAFVTSNAIDTTGAGFIVCVLGYALSGNLNAAVTDSQGNTYSVAGHGSTTSSRTSSIFFCQSPTTNASHTFTGTGSFTSICVLAFSGQAASVDAITNTVGSSVTTLAPGSITPSTNNALLITGLCFPTTSSATINASFTISDQVGGTNGQFDAAAYLIQTSAAAANPTWSFASNTGATTMAAFRLATASSATGGAWASA